MRGEQACLGRVRGTDFLEGWNTKTASGMRERTHLCQLVHNGEKQTFSMSIVGSFQSCLERQINEAVRISSNTADPILNSKSEFHQAPIVRVVTTNGLQTEQGEEEVVVRGRGGGRRAERGQ